MSCGDEPPRAGKAAPIHRGATRWDLLTAAWAKGTNALLLIKFAAVPNPDHDDLLEAVVDFITNRPVADSYSPNTLCASNLETSGGAGIGS